MRGPRVFFALPFWLLIFLLPFFLVAFTIWALFVTLKLLVYLTALVVGLVRRYRARHAEPVEDEAKPDPVGRVDQWA